jgi:putative spermidine/putrescine transport system substrate-binding protein
MKTFKSIFILLLIAMFLITGCSNSTKEETKKDVTKKDALTSEWKDIATEAKGTTVNLYMWGGDEGINQYIDEFIAPQLKDEYDLVLKRYPMDAAEFINKLKTEKKANKKTGEMDVIWINGENFKTAKKEGLLQGPFTNNLPNFQQFVDGNSPDVAYDFGFPTEGYEAPWGKVQFVFAYDSSKVENPPKSIVELAQWVKANPGKFTYPAPPDFTGSAFIRHVLHETSSDYNAYLEKFDEKLIEKDSAGMWKALNDMKPNLWREGKSYPESLAQLDQLYKNGEVWMTMGYNEANASNMIKSGEYPATTKTFVLDKGTLSNTHFLAIPFNAPNAFGAQVVIDFLLSPEAQLKKMELEYWGENTSLTFDHLSDEDQKTMNSIDRGPATLSQEILSKHRVAEIGGDYVQWLERGWIENVGKEK